MIFTGKYGNMNFILKITYYPTYLVNIIRARVATLTWRRDMHGNFIFILK